ncbi:MAG: type II toxin-antitoxin system RelE/ParE family toxin [Lentisphaeria bacterium]|nr:type II toxin-antitoxin system RelE/ParE family toxin [Lentisphaeria bacterium]
MLENNLINIHYKLYFETMWNVEFTEEFAEWWHSLSETEQVSVDASVRLLENLGPNLSRPYVDTIKGSKHSNMKELRSQSGGNPLRTLFVFDPRRSAILLVGGDKTGDNRFYERMVPAADRIYTNYLNELRQEGLI